MKKSKFRTEIKRTRNKGNNRNNIRVLLFKITF